ncbi:ATP-dependent DNA ligase [Candidatus Woesearchaeota archaeon]|nr:ATP-dependent DNA ligase [Candidatus Woesearchaeota archaeon]
MKYEKLVEVYEDIEKTSKRLQITKLIADLFKKTSADDLGMIALLLQGRLFPASDERKIGVASQMAIKALTIATGISKDAVVKEWKKKGDLGLVAEELVKKKKQRTLLSSTSLTVKKVFENLQKLVEMGGAGSVDRKLKLIAELLSAAKPLEAKYIIKTVLEELRLGVGEGSIRDAIVWAFFAKEVGLKYDSKSHKASYNEEYKNYIKAVRNAFDLTNDFGQVAKLAKTKGLKGLKKTKLVLGTPIKVMLGPKEDSVAEAMDRVGKPAAIEPKFDGFRLQIHKVGNDVKLFTRRLDNVSAAFPEVVKYAKECIKAKECLLDSEAVGFDAKTGKYRPFQEISQRIKRKHNIDQLVKKLPVEVNVFDIIYYNGKDLLNEPFEKRREILKKILHSKKKKFVIVPQITTSDEKKAEKYYHDALDIGHEGVMFKNLKSPYKPGARVGHMVKFKPVMEPFEVVIVGAEWGTGKRSGWLTSYNIACRDDGEFKELGKVSTGLKEKKEEGLSFGEMTKILKALVTKERGRHVTVDPQIVIEVAFGEIQKSPTYSSGYALRFPRITRLREDRGPNDCTTLDEVKAAYKKQKK